MVDVLITWPTRRTFDDAKVEDEDSRKHNILCYLQSFNMTYVNDMQSWFENMMDYMKNWRAFLNNDVFKHLSDLAKLRTASKGRDAPVQEKLITTRIHTIVVLNRKM